MEVKAHTAADVMKISDNKLETSEDSFLAHTRGEHVSVRLIDVAQIQNERMYIKVDQIVDLACFKRNLHEENSKALQESMRGQGYKYELCIMIVVFLKDLSTGASAEDIKFKKDGG